jgi:hypothetical protein
VPETSAATPQQLTASLAARIDGPYADADTAATADLAAEAARYLNYAAAKGGITDPATIAALASSLATAVYRLPQLLNTISAWLVAETASGRIADDHRRAAGQLTDRIRATFRQAADNADELAAVLVAAHNLTATLHTATPAALASTPSSQDRQTPNCNG